MRILLLKLCLFSLALYLPVAAFIEWAPLRWGNVSHVSVKFYNDVIAQKVDFKPPQTLIMGASAMAQAVNPNLLSDSKLLTLWGASFVELYYGFKKYVEVKSAPRCLIIANPYFPEKVYRTEFFWRVFVAADFYNFSELKEVFDANKKFDGRLTKSSEIHRYIRSALYMGNFFPYYAPLIQRGFMPGFSEQNLWAYNKAQRTAGYMPFPPEAKEREFVRDWYRFVRRPFKRSELYQYYLEQLVSLAEANGTHVVYLFPPIFEPFLGERGKEYVENVYGEVASIINKHPDNQVLRGIPSFKKRLYRDAFHLSPKGARLFTKFLKESVSCINAPASANKDSSEKVARTHEAVNT